MTSSLCSARHIVEIIDTLDIKRYMALPLDEGEIATRFTDFGEFDNFAVV